MIGFGKPIASKRVVGTPLGERVRSARKAQGLSAEGLAARSLVCLRTIQRLEAGVTPEPRRATRKTIADALGLDPAEFGWDGEVA